MGRLISEKYAIWQAECEAHFQQLKKNEEGLNRIFIGIYGLQDELTPDVADKDVTVHRVFDTKDDVPESMKGSNYVRTMRDEVVSLIPTRLVACSGGIHWMWMALPMPAANGTAASIRLSSRTRTTSFPSATMIILMTTSPVVSSSGWQRSTAMTRWRRT